MENNLFKELSFDSDLIIPVLDLDSNKVIGDAFFPSTIPAFSSSAKDRIIALLARAQAKKGAELYIPCYKGEQFSLMSDNNIYHLSLDSEDERVVWRLSELRDRGYNLFVIREISIKEVEGISSLSVEELLSSLNF